MKQLKANDCAYLKERQHLQVLVNGTNEKGARAKGQKFLKEHGLFDGWLTLESLTPMASGRHMFLFKVFSPTLLIKRELEQMTSNITL